MLSGAILQILSDGDFHSGTAIGARLGVTRAAVCKSIAALRKGGLPVHRVPGKGYRAPAPFVPLSERTLRAQLDVGTELDLTILPRADSTNAYLLDQPAAEPPRMQVCLAESQQAGRGRRGRQWIATPYSNILLSISHRFPFGPESLGGLSLAAGVAVVRALEAYGVTGVGLKWPNDVIWKERKLAGLLLDLRGESGGPCRVVAGVGVNLHLAPDDARLIDQAWVDLGGVLGAPVDRSGLAGLLIKHLVRVFLDFGERGFGAYQSQWERQHVYHGRHVRVRRDNEQAEGVVTGVDAHGALLLRMGDGQVRRFHAGDVSLRSVS